MKILFSLILGFHGAIHILGFLKAFKLAKIEQINNEISKTSGLVWLFVTILFILTLIAYLLKLQYWHWIALPAVLISTILIITTWSDSKFGSIPNIIISIVALISLYSNSMERKIQNEVRSILSKAELTNIQTINISQLENLPQAVKKWLSYSGIVGKKEVQTVWLSQNAKMKMKPEQEKWFDAKAEQYFTIENPAFIWSVKMKMPPFFKIKGRDRFVDGKGEMLIKIFTAINIVNASGPKIDEGTLQRYLAEIVWFPSAALSEYISWEPIDSLSSKAVMKYQDKIVSGTFYFNEEGEFKKFTTLRYMGNEPESKKYEWVINVKETSHFNNIRIPTKMDLTWMLEDGPWTWLEIEITDIRYNEDVPV
jgi:Family of unknown function (DUF6544)